MNHSFDRDCMTEYFTNLIISNIYIFVVWQKMVPEQSTLRGLIFPR